ncbi:MAG: heme ABC transporter permease [Chromatiales bacterium]|nr:heme ABC transporter permease [Chromatiales bacterium]
MKTLYRWGSLPFFYRWTHSLLPWLYALTAVLFVFGLYWGLYIAPPDYKQGEAYRIIYIHVPAAWMSLFVYIVMASCGLILLVWRVKLAELIHKECAVIGAAFTAITLLTGMLWGKPMWGAFWVWDARLTSELILLFLYLGIIVLGSAITDPRKSVRATAVLAIVGIVNIPIIHYSVIWWNTLHQGPTITKLDAPSAHSTILLPLLYMAVVFKLYFITVLFARVRAAIVETCQQQYWFKQYEGLAEK